MDQLAAMRLFTRIVERRSFTLAAQDIGIPRSTATQVLKRLEDRLNARLLQRTTRTVTPTLDGEAYYRRCLAILADVEDAEGAFKGAKPRGPLHADVHGTLARHFLFPRLPDFLRRYPDIQLQISEGDRLVDLVREGVDCVLRVGSLSDSTMIGRSVAMLDEVTVASPAYLKRHGTPRTPDDPTAISAAAPVIAARARLHRVGQSGILCRRIEHSRSSAQHMNLHRSRDRATLPKSNPPETGSTPDCPGKKRRSDFRHIAACRQ